METTWIMGLCRGLYKWIMEKKMETTIWGLGFRAYGFRVSGYYPPIMENQMEQELDNEVETTIGFRVVLGELQ